MSDGVHDYEKNMATCCGDVGAKAPKPEADELTVLPEEDPKPEGHKPDLSWLVVAVDGAGDGWVMDKADGFDEVDLMPNGNSCLDNGVYMPKDLPMGLYRVTDVRVSGGQLVQSPLGDDYTDTEISGTWELLVKQVDDTFGVGGNVETTEADMIEACAVYLEELEANMLTNDIDMLMDGCEAPSLWAERLRRRISSAGPERDLSEDLYVVFDGPPGPKSGRFVELHDWKGRGIGERSGVGWTQDDGLWLLGPFRSRPKVTTGCKSAELLAQWADVLEGDEVSSLMLAGRILEVFNAGSLARDLRHVATSMGREWRGMGSAPHDGETFLLDRGGSYTHAVPCFRYHTITNAETGSVEGGGWTVLDGCPDEGGFGCANTFVPDSLVPDEWRWSPMLETGGGR